LKEELPFKLYRHIGLKGCYFIYKCQFDVDKKKTRNNWGASREQNSLFMFIKNKTKLLNKLIEVVAYKF
jgi:hypothetical protein